jgi:mannose-6-phosphate isomerase-like protein (cupin superfamily)
MDMGVGHYDSAPPHQIGVDDLERLREEDGLRFANQLSAWVEVEDGEIVDAGYHGGAVVGATTARIGPGSVTIPGVGFPVIQEPVEIREGTARFVQTAGGRTGAPLPRRIDRPPYVRITAPTAWTTLALTISADGTADLEVTGASSFPRHWIYDDRGELVSKSGLIDFSEWTRTADHTRTPWHGVERETLVSAVETAVERSLSHDVMGSKPDIRRIAKGDDLTRQGESGDEIYLILDGMMQVDVDGTAIAELGPGAIVGERAVLEAGLRTSTVTALTTAKVAAIRGYDLPEADLVEVAKGHRREES